MKLLQNASALKRKVIASYYYISGLIEIFIVSNSYRSSLIGIAITTFSYRLKVTMGEVIVTAL
jgi:hypothetical protein